MFPDRDHASDGAVGDVAHQAETSGHNPDDTAGSRAAWNDADGLREVRAWDMDSDLRMPGVDAQDVVDHIRALPGVSAVLRYLIYNRRIYHCRDGFAPSLYTGPSPHTEHIHFEGAWSQTADNTTDYDYRLGVFVALSADDRKFITDLFAALPAKVWAYELEDPTSARTPKATKPAGAYVRYNDVVNNSSTASIVAAVSAALTAATKTGGTVDVDQLAAVLAPLLAQAKHV